MLECNFGGMFWLGSRSNGKATSRSLRDDKQRDIQRQKAVAEESGRGPHDAHHTTQRQAHGVPGFVALHLGTALLGGGLEDGGGAVEGFGERGKLGLGARCVGDVDGLVDAWDDDGGVAGELAWGVDGVLEPRAFG
jgi:hypothetical protein